ncbi:Spy/CpxP family protein refolding chaperone [Vibrio neptunius]|uniref:Spy/CpxP family protein refolding chaperone n=1 Tax=Vibrio neptunius TaxID=170651 RepID=UPI003CE58CF0
MRKIFILSILACFSSITVADSTSSYVGQESREIKALSQEKVRGLLDGNGLGYAKVAELNGYPGPAHVLELSKELQLSEEQKEQTEELFNTMKNNAKVLGSDLITAEKELEIAFVSGEISESKVTSSIQNIALIEGKLRAVHVNAHLVQKAILTPNQVHKYNKLRGYSSKGHHHH